MVFHWSLSDKVPRVSSTLLNIFADFSKYSMYLPNSPNGQDVTQGQFLNEDKQVWTQGFPSSRLVALTEAKEPHQPCYLPIADGRIRGFIPFPRVLVLCKVQSASSRFKLVSLCPFPIWQGPSTCLSFRFLWFSLCGPPGQQSRLISWSFLFVYSKNVSSSGWDLRRRLQ